MTTPAMPALFNAFEDSSIKIEFSFQRKNNNEHHIKAFYTNKLAAPMTGVNLQVAVQGYMKIQLLAISSNEIAPLSAQQVTQEMNVINS